MTAIAVNGRPLEDAETALREARFNFQGEQWVATVQRAQNCAELSVKAIIALFAVPIFEHNPGSQLRGAVRDNQRGIRQRCGEEMLARLEQLAVDADAIASWHGWSTYGRNETDGTHTTATRLCTPERAAWAVEVAGRSFATASDFVQGWWA
jgi:HEPN domain-containing protein